MPSLRHYVPFFFRIATPTKEDTYNQVFRSDTPELRRRPSIHNKRHAMMLQRAPHSWQEGYQVVVDDPSVPFVCKNVEKPS